MKTLTINIENLIEIPAFRNFYVEQPIDDLEQSYKLDGQKTPIHISENNEIINGYRMVDAIREAGGNTVMAIVMPGNPDIYLRILLNKTREKSTIDRVKEVKEVFKRFPNRRGERNADGSTYRRHELISSSLNNRWKGENVVRKMEYVIENDIEGDVLLKGIVDKNWKVETCEEFLKVNKPIDEKNEYGFTERLSKGEINITDVNKLITKKYFLDNKYKHSFVIPEKCNSYQIDCTKITELKEFINSVDLVFTSPPYLQLRRYENGEKNQLGSEKTKEEYCKKLTDIFGKIYPTLKQTGNVIINIGESYEDGVGQGIPFLLKQYIELYTPLIYKDTLIWSKPNPKPQNDTVLRPWNSIEYLLWFVVDPAKAKYNKLTFPVEGKKTKISKGVKDVDQFGNVWGKHISLTGDYGRIFSHLEEQKITHIIKTAAGKNSDVYKIFEEGHPAIMSAALPVVPILMTTDEGNRIYDPFAGSNVVGRVSCILNRVALTTELSEDYFKIGCRMLEEGIERFDRSSLDIINRVVSHCDSEITNPNQLNKAA